MTALLHLLLPLFLAFSKNKVDNQYSEKQSLADLTIEIVNLKNSKGKILILLFNKPAGFPDQGDKSIFAGDFEAKKTIVIPQIPEGNYALTLVHDEDGDGKLKTNMFGVPKEGYSFSNAKGNWLERPEYNKALFAHRKGKPLTIKMMY